MLLIITLQGHVKRINDVHYAPRKSGGNSQLSERLPGLGVAAAPICALGNRRIRMSVSSSAIKQVPGQSGLHETWGQNGSRAQRVALKLRSCTVVSKNQVQL